MGLLGTEKELSPKRNEIIKIKEQYDPSPKKIQYPV